MVIIQQLLLTRFPEISRLKLKGLIQWTAWLMIGHIKVFKKGVSCYIFLNCCGNERSLVDSCFSQRVKTKMETKGISSYHHRMIDHRMIDAGQDSMWPDTGTLDRHLSNLILAPAVNSLCETINNISISVASCQKLFDTGRDTLSSMLFILM